MSNTVKLIIAVIVIAGVIFFGMKMMDKGAAPEGMAPAAEEMAPADDATSEAAPVEEPTAMDNAADAASDAAEAVGDAASDAADASSGARVFFCLNSGGGFDDHHYRPHGHRR